MKCTAFCFRLTLDSSIWWNDFLIVLPSPPLHFIGYQGARNRAREAVKRCNAGSLLNTGSSGDLTELNHGSQTATGRRRLIKVTNLPLRVRSVSSNGSLRVEYANIYACVRACMHVRWAFCHVIQVQNVSFHLWLILHTQASVPWLIICAFI